MKKTVPGDDTMPIQPKPVPALSGNTLKLIAAASMLIDHVGLIFFPRVAFFRILGRLAFPIYAFMIAEGCKYTHNRARYFCNLALLAALCQMVYYLADHSLYMCILVTFSLSVLVVYALQNFKKAPSFPSALILAAAVGTVYVLNLVFEIDYGFWGCLVPVFAALLHDTPYDTPRWNTAMLGAGLLLVCAYYGGIQFYSLLALPLLWCYSGKRGRRKLKYFFYIFYPAHLVLLQALYWLIK